MLKFPAISLIFRFASPSLSTISCFSTLSDQSEIQNLSDSRTIFSKIQYPNVQLYTKMINGYCRHNRLKDALQVFDKMPGRDTIAWNSMIKGCLDCGDLVMGRKLFDEMPQRNVRSWTIMINGYMKLGFVEVAEVLFQEMLFRDVAVWNAMIHGYCVNGRIDEGFDVFERMPLRNVISWTSIICGFDQNGRSSDALILFKRMVGFGIKPASRTFSCVISACANLLALKQGLQVHASVLKSGFSVDEFICASLITFYANCKEVESFQKVFYENVHDNVVVWTSFLTAYSVNSKHGDALKVFSEMVKIGVLPNQSSFTSALNSCSALEAIDRGKEVHGVAIKLGFEDDAFVGNSLVVLYSKCGSIEDGVKAFKLIKDKNLVSWNSIICGCAQHGWGLQALAFFAQMIRVKIDPDEITLTGLLYACTHSSTPQKGRLFFHYFSKHTSVKLNLEHYACLVDIIGRSGNLEEAEEFTKNMPVEPNSMVWLALLSACKMYSNLEVGERAMKKILDLEPHCSAAYTLLSNMYASACRWSDVSSIRKGMQKKGIVKQQGRSWVTLQGKKHEFLSGDRSHPLTKEIYQKLNWLDGKLKEFGHVPDKKFALHDVEDEQKESMLSYHSERLAIGFALISTIEGSPITVMKNLRICGDCHAAIKLIAKIVEREIIIRDSSRFHHFKNGICSCGDYW